MYTHINFKTKKELREALKAGKKITVYQPNDIGYSAPPTQGTVYLEGPHYPQPHKWYATGHLIDGYLVSIQ
jgi:hypothetical protein